MHRRHAAQRHLHRTSALRQLVRRLQRAARAGAGRNLPEGEELDADGSVEEQGRQKDVEEEVGGVHAEPQRRRVGEVRKVPEVRGCLDAGACMCTLAHGVGTTEHPDRGQFAMQPKTMQPKRTAMATCRGAPAQRIQTDDSLPETMQPRRTAMAA